MIQQLAALDISEAAFLTGRPRSSSPPCCTWPRSVHAHACERVSTGRRGCDGGRRLSTHRCRQYRFAMARVARWQRCTRRRRPCDFAAGLGADQVVSGLALTILGLGMANFIGDSYTDDTRRSQFADVDIPVLSDIPWVGETVLLGNTGHLSRHCAGDRNMVRHESDRRRTRSSVPWARAHRQPMRQAIWSWAHGQWRCWSAEHSLASPGRISRRRRLSAPGARASRQVAAGLLLRSSSSSVACGPCRHGSSAVRIHTRPADPPATVWRRFLSDLVVDVPAHPHGDRVDHHFRSVHAISHRRRPPVSVLRTTRGALEPTPELALEASGLPASRQWKRVSGTNRLIHQISTSKPTDGPMPQKRFVTDLILRRRLLVGKTNVHRRRRSLGPPPPRWPKGKRRNCEGRKRGCLGYRGSERGEGSGRRAPCGGPLRRRPPAVRSTRGS